MKSNLLFPILIAAGMATAAAAPITVQNYDFDDPALAVGGFTGNNFTNGFTFVFSGVEYPNPAGGQWNFVDDTLPSPASGSQLAFMNGVATGGGERSYMYQDVGLLQANTTYTLTVAVGARIDQGFGSISLGFVNGVSFDALNPTNLLAQSDALVATTLGNFNDVSFSFTTGDIVSGDLTIFIQNVSGDGLGSTPVSIDNVRLDATAVPEPATVALVIGGLVMALARGRRRQI